MKIPRHTMLCESGSIVIVPFPFVDSPNTKRRPALVLSRKTFNDLHRHTILAMITTGKSSTWHSDIPITDLESAGLPEPSVIRMKLFTLDNRCIIKRMGFLKKKDQKNVVRMMHKEILGE